MSWLGISRKDHSSSQQSLPMEPSLSPSGSNSLLLDNRAEVITHFSSPPVPLLNFSQIAQLSVPACFLWGPWLGHSLPILKYLCTNRRKTHAFSLYVKAWICCPILSLTCWVLTGGQFDLIKIIQNWRSDDLGLGFGSAITFCEFGKVTWLFCGSWFFCQMKILNQMISTILSSDYSTVTRIFPSRVVASLWC